MINITFQIEMGFIMLLKTWMAVDNCTVSLITNLCPVKALPDHPLHLTRPKLRLWGAGTKRLSRITTSLLVLGILLLTTACGEQTTKLITPAPGVEVIVTAWTAEVIGELVNIEGCLRIRNEQSNVDYALVWPPDVSITVESDQVRIISGNVRGSRREVVLHYGDVVRFSGGETEHLDKQYLQNLPSNCWGPYWVVGFEISPVPPFGEP